MAERGLSALKSASTAPPAHTSASACPHPRMAAHLPSSRGNPLGGGDVHLAAATIASPAPWGSTSGRHWAHRVRSHPRTTVSGVPAPPRSAQAVGSARPPPSPPVSHCAAQSEHVSP